MLVAHLDRDLAGVTLRQPVPSDLSRRAGRLEFGGIEAVELQAFAIGNKLGPSRTSK